MIHWKNLWPLVGWGLLLVSAHAMAQSTVTYVYTDPQGTPLAEADVNGNITAQFDYTPYGNIALGTAPNGPGYTGHVNDPDTDLVYMQARYYDPTVGRFINTDPVEPAAGNAFNFNRYAYVNNNPIMGTDPTGKFANNLNGAQMQCEIYIASGCGTAAAEPVPGLGPAVSETFFPNSSDSMDEQMGQMEKDIQPSSDPFGGSESISSMAARINHETMGMMNTPYETESVFDARKDIAHMHLNGIEKYGNDVESLAGIATPKVDSSYGNALLAVQQSVIEKMYGIDPTNAATNFNMRTPHQEAVDGAFQGMAIHTVAGPYISPSKYKYILTYGN